MSNQVELMIVATEAKAKLKGITDLEERLLAAMRASKDHWMVLDKEVQLRGAIAVLMILEDEGNDEDRDRINEELRALQTLNAAASGISVDFSALGALKNPVGLIRLWEAVQKENT